MYHRAWRHAHVKITRVKRVFLVGADGIVSLEITKLRQALSISDICFGEMKSWQNVIGFISQRNCKNILIIFRSLFEHYRLKVVHGKLAFYSILYQ